MEAATATMAFIGPRRADSLDKLESLTERPLYPAPGVVRTVTFPLAPTSASVERIAGCDQPRSAFLGAPYLRDAIVGLGMIRETFETAIRGTDSRRSTPP